MQVIFDVRVATHVRVRLDFGRHSLIFFRRRCVGFQVASNPQGRLLIVGSIGAIRKARVRTSLTWSGEGMFAGANAIALMLEF